MQLWALQHKYTRTRFWTHEYNDIWCQRGKIQWTFAHIDIEWLSQYRENWSSLLQNSTKSDSDNKDFCVKKSKSIVEKNVFTARYKKGGFSRGNFKSTDGELCTFIL